jgi:hypothetical protein
LLKKTMKIHASSSSRAAAMSSIPGDQVMANLVAADARSAVMQNAFGPIGGVVTTDATQAIIDRA